MKIAIQGHPTRGKEIIQILRSLGATSYGAYDTCSHPEWYWYINKNKEITCDPKRSVCGYKLYTLEEFERKFPFKVGDKVMWPVKVGWWSGIIVDLSPDYYKIIDDKCNYHFVEASKLKLYPMQKERNITLTLDKAKEWYKKGGELKEIALQAFTEKELNPLPRNWEEFCEKHPIQNYEAFINYTNSSITVCKECAGSGLGVWKRKPEKDRCKCPSQKSAEAHLAMMQLEQLRNCWWNGWEPIWDCSEKWCIRLWGNELGVGVATHISRFLTFPTNEMAREFLECFRDLIEKARDLI